MSGPVPVAAPTAATSPSRRAWVAAAVAALLALHYALAVGSKFSASTTSDELVHLTAGLSYWQNHDYRLHPENGILPQRWAALPAWLFGTKFPALADNPYWRTSDAWVVGHQVFYESGNDHFPRLLAGRAMIGLFSVATGLLVFVWSRRWFGLAGGFLSLGFFVFSPDFLAHGALVTSDACAAFFLLAATGAWWWHLHDRRWSVALLSATLLGFAFVAKYSAVLLLPMMALMAAVRILRPAPLELGSRRYETRAAKAGVIVASFLAHGAAIVGVIWLCYGFRYTAFNPALPPATQFIRTWEFMEGQTGFAGVVIHACREARLLPEAFLYGFAYVVQTVASRSAFLNGEYSLTGWSTFFAWTFALKTTLALIAAAVIALWLTLRRWWRDATWRTEAYRATPLLVFFVIYWASSLTSHLNIGHRHILPTYPVMFIALGSLGAWMTAGPRVLRALALTLLAWHATAAARVAPYYLAYFNELAGGPANGWRHLVDSSLDWGQDLAGLARWLQENPSDRPAYLSYFGTSSPSYYHLPVRRLPFANNFRFPVIYTPLEAGTYCVSATMLQHVYSPVRGATWTVELEREFEGLRELEPAFARYTKDPEERRKLLENAPAAQWERGIARFDVLRFARLCHYLRLRTPDHHIGYSIFIHRLSAAEVHAAVGGTLKEWQALLERTARPRS